MHKKQKEHTNLYNYDYYNYKRIYHRKYSCSNQLDMKYKLTVILIFQKDLLKKSKKRGYI